MSALQRQWKIPAALSAVAVAVALGQPMIALADSPNLDAAALNPASGSYGLTAVPYLMPDSNNEQVWVWSGQYQDSFELIDFARDDLADLASAAPGTTISVAAPMGSVTLTYNGGGGFSGTYDGLTFGFYRNDLAGVGQGDAGAKLLAQARVAALTADRPTELSVAKAVLAALSK